MDFGIQGKIALVTAGSKGLGRGCAEALSAEGARVAICARTTAEVERTAQEIAAKTGHEVLAFTADMSKPGEIDRLLASVREAMGDPDILVCNAGGPPPGDFASTGLDAFGPALELSLMSSVRLTYGCVSAMKEKGWGRIVMITSVSVRQPIPYLILSNTARAGLAGFMKTVAREIADSGVTVNAALPGSHDTDRIRQTAVKRAEAAGRTLEEEMTESLKTINPMKRMGTPDEFGALVTFLCSKQAAFITGENVLADGGAYGGIL